VKARVVFWGGVVIGTALLVWMLRAYGGAAIDVLGSDVSVPGLFAVGLAIFATIACLSVRWRYLLAGLTLPPPFHVVALQRSAGHVLAVLIPSGKLGGDPLRAWLATRVGVSGGDAVASVAADRTLETLASAPFSILFALLLLQHGIPELDRALITILIGTGVLFAAVVLVARALHRGRGIASELVRRIAPQPADGPGSGTAVIEAAERAAATLLGRREQLGVAFAIGIVANVLVILEFWALLVAFGLPADGLAIVAAIFATGAAHALPIPAGIGALEGAQVWLFGMLGHPVEVGLAVGLAVRCRELLWMLPGLGYLLVTTLRASAERAADADADGAAAS